MHTGNSRVGASEVNWQNDRLFVSSGCCLSSMRLRVSLLFLKDIDNYSNFKMRWENNCISITVVQFQWIIYSSENKNKEKKLEGLNKVGNRRVKKSSICVKHTRRASAVESAVEGSLAVTLRSEMFRSVCMQQTRLTAQLRPPRLVTLRRTVQRRHEHPLLHHSNGASFRNRKKIDSTLTK